MNTFEEDIARGYLEDGQPLEAEYGTGWWTEMGEPDRLPPIVQCHMCGGQAYWLESDGVIDCENCEIDACG